MEDTVTTEVRYRACAGESEVTIDERGGVYVNGEPADGLAGMTYDFLMFLASAHGQVRTVPMCLDRFYPDGDAAQFRIFDVLACKARNVLEALHPDAAETIRTVWGRGYAFGHPPAMPVPLGRHLYLPPHNARWTPSRKAHVLAEIRKGRATERQVLQHYPDLSREELKEWFRQYLRNGKKGLRTTKVQAYGHAIA